jgi:AcrR family transcriptional regulator
MSCINVASVADERRRPGGRTARVTGAVRAATLAALTEHGWNGLTVEDVAARAGVNKTTIYRRWGGREALVADVLLAVSDQQIPLPDTGSLRGDLAAFARQVATTRSWRPANRALCPPSPPAPRQRARRARPPLLGGPLRPGPAEIDRAVARGELAGGRGRRRARRAVVGPVWFGVFGPGTVVDDTFRRGLRRHRAAGERRGALTAENCRRIRGEVILASAFTK